MTEIGCLDSVEVDATKLAWRVDVIKIRCLDSKEVGAMSQRRSLRKRGGLDSEA